MKQPNIITTMLIVFAIGITGCKKDDNPGNAGNTGNTNQASTVPTFSNFGGPAPVNVIAVVRTSTEVTVAGFTVINDATVGTAVFGNPGQDKGDVKVTVGSTDFPFTKNAANGSVSYTYTPGVSNPTGITLNTGATSVVCSAASYAISPNAVTVPGQLKLVAPAASASVPRGSNLAVSWTVTNPGAHAAVFITDYSGHSKFYENLSGTSFSIPATDLQTLSAGNAIVYAISYNYVLANSNATVLIGEAVALRTITLQ